MTKTSAKTLATATSEADAAVPKARSKAATKVSTAADDAAAPSSLKKPSPKADNESMTAAKSPAADPKLASAWKAKAGKDLSEPELLAMPDSEYMGEKQLEFFRTKLQALKDKVFALEPDFREEVSKLLAPEETAKHREALLKAAAIPGIGNGGVVNNMHGALLLSGVFAETKAAEQTRKDLVDRLVKSQKPDGSWEFQNRNEQEPASPPLKTHKRLQPEAQATCMGTDSARRRKARPAGVRRMMTRRSSSVARSRLNQPAACMRLSTGVRVPESR